MGRIDQAIEKASKLRQLKSSEESVPANSEIISTQQPVDEREQLLDVDPIQVENPFITLFNKRFDPAAEEYKKLRSIVKKMTQGKEFRNALMVTSTISSEGKTITSINLAMALAQEYDHTVLLVDADLRKPAVHRYLNINPEVGLVQCLKDGVPLDRALIKTGLGKLVILPAGGQVDDPVEFLSSNRMKDLVAELKNRYPDRFIIFDTPPILPFADGQALGNFVDGVLFVVREGCAKLGQVKEALKSVDPEKLLGVVYNDTEFTPQQGKYYYY